MTYPNDILLIAGNGPLRFWCRIFGHKWTPFDMNWCGQDQFRCWRCGGFKLAPTPNVSGLSHTGGDRG